VIGPGNALALPVLSFCRLLLLLDLDEDQTKSNINSIKNRPAEERFKFHGGQI
jgi:hypothetical protein